ncbi:hypothetical protein X777_03813, partial [Ooceraea biroi]
ESLKVVYTLPSKNRRHTSRVIEVSPEVRNELKKESRIFICYSACRFSDYVRTLQCFRCLDFGHISTNCKERATCGHCSGSHDTRECTCKDSEPTCVNCMKWNPRGDLKHTAVDSLRCSILKKRILQKIQMINYG